MLIFRQLFDQTSSTYTYLLGDSASGEAVLIDPSSSRPAAMALIAELGLRLQWTVDTHVHADHVTGAWLLKQHAGSRIAISAASGARAPTATCRTATPSPSARATCWCAPRQAYQRLHQYGARRRAWPSPATAC